MGTPWEKEGDGELHPSCAIRRLKARNVGSTGMAPRVVLVHGFPDTWETWSEFGHLLADVGYDVTALSRRGTMVENAEDLPDLPADPDGVGLDEFGIEHHIADLVTVIDRRRGEGSGPVHVVGHDWGAQIAWLTACLHPDKIATVTGIGTPFIKPAEKRPAINYKPKDRRLYLWYFMRETADAVTEIVGDRADGAADWLRKLFANSAARQPTAYVPESGQLSDGWPDRAAPEWMDDDAIASLANSYLGRKRAAVMLALYHRLDADWQYLRAALGLTGPDVKVRCSTRALYLVGTDDEVAAVSKRHEAALADSFPNLAGIARIPDAGHWVHREKPELVASALLRFWADDTPSRYLAPLDRDVLGALDDRFDVERPITVRTAHPGLRPSPGPGIWMSGTFTYTYPEFAGRAPITITARFSVTGSGPEIKGADSKNPHTHSENPRSGAENPHTDSENPRSGAEHSLSDSDKDALARPDTLGLAIRFGDDDHADVATVNVPLFLARDPAIFASEVLPALKIRDQRPAPDRPDRLDLLVEKYRGTPNDIRGPLIAFGRQLQRGWPVGMAHATFHSNHAFGFPFAEGIRWARFRFEPDAGDRCLPLGSLQPDYRAKVTERLKQHGPIRFTMALQMATDAEPLDSPTEHWPETLERLILGRVELDQVAEGDAATVKETNWLFRPDQPPLGMIVHPGDTAMQARASAYQASGVERGACQATGKRCQKPATDHGAGEQERA